MPRLTNQTHSLAALIGTIQPIRLLSERLPGDLQPEPDPRVCLCRVLSVNQPYGVPRLLVTPAAGTGQAWVNADKLVIGKE